MIGPARAAKMALISPGQFWTAKIPRDGRTVEVLAVTITGMVRTRVIACTGTTLTGKLRNPAPTPSFMTSTFLRSFEPSVGPPAKAEAFDWGAIRDQVASIGLSLTTRECSALLRAVAGKPPLTAQPYLLDRVLAKVREAS